MSEPPAIPNNQFVQYRGLVAAFGFVPNVFRMQSELPQAIEAETQLFDAIVTADNLLTKRQKAGLLHNVACASHNLYCQALFARSPEVVSEPSSPLAAFGRKLARFAPWFSGKDVESLKKAGLDDIAILEAVLTVAVAQMLCTLAKGLQPELDSGLAPPASGDLPQDAEFFDWVETPGPYLQREGDPGTGFQPCTFFREQFGFVPNLFQVQSSRPAAVEAEAQVLDRILIPEDHLSRVQKENILLVVSAANLNTYCVAVHTQILGALGIAEEDSDKVVEDHRAASIAAEDIALLDEAGKLALGRTEARFEAEALRSHGFTEAQIVEAVAMSALTNFLNTLQAGLGAVPDFPPRRVFGPKDLYRFSGRVRPTDEAVSANDPDAEFVARVQSGEIDAFEELVRRHTRRVVTTLAGIVGNMDDAQDAAQDVFLKAFENIQRFQGRSKFSTWLVSITINTGTQLLRQRKPNDSLDEEDDEGFRPRRIQRWTDDPEQLVAASQRDFLVREGILRLPEKYRIAVLVRDINQFSTEEAAGALGISVPALKARVLRGRLMLRESLAPHFVRAEKESPDA